MERLWVPGRRALIVVLVMSTVMGAAGELTTSAVMPVIARDLNGERLYGWAFSSLQLGTLVGTILAGTSADRRGPRFPFITGKILMGGGLVAIIAAQTMVTVIAGRAAMGLGLGLFGGAAFAAQATSVPAQLRTRLLTITTSMWLPTAIVVPQAAARLQQAFGWRAAYAPLVVLAIVALVVGAPVLPHRPDRVTTPPVLHNALGIAGGAAMFFVALAQSRWVVAMAMAVAAGLAGSLGVTLGVWIHHRYASRYTAERLARVAVVVLAIGLAGFCAGLSPSVPIAAMLGCIIVQSSGWGMAVNLTGEAAMALAPAGEEGRATAASSMFQTLGFAMGPGIGGACVAVSIARGGGAAPGILAAAAIAMCTLTAIFVLVPRVGRGIAIDVAPPSPPHPQPMGAGQDRT